MSKRYLCVGDLTLSNADPCDPAIQALMAGSIRRDLDELLAMAADERKAGHADTSWSQLSRVSTALRMAKHRCEGISTEANRARHGRY